MAGTVTITEQDAFSVKRIHFDWLSAAGGAADGTTTKKYNGVIWRVVWIPDAGGTAPDPNYDVVVNDDDGADILDGAGADRSQTAIEQLTPILGIGAVAQSKLTLGVTNAGAAKGGTVIVYIR